MKNLSTAIMLLDPRVRAIAVTYEKIDYNEDTTKQMKYSPAYLATGSLPSGAVLFKTMDPDITVGTYVIVPTNTRHGMTVCKVVGVDVPVNFEDQDEVYWIVGTVDTAPFEKIRQEEEQVLLAVKKSADDKMRDEARAAFMDGLPSNLPQIGGPDVSGEPTEPETITSGEED
jgi:hypothetical protein